MVRLARQLQDQLPALPSQAVAITSWGRPGQRDDRDELVREYFQWCESQGSPGDCLRLLRGGLYLSEEAKVQLAFALASAGVWEGTADVIGEVINPVQLQIALVSSICVTMGLLAIPEPISKAIVLTLTVTMVAYLGWDTLSGLIEGWKRLDAEAKRARTFGELREAGRRFGRVMGEKVTRLLLMAATAALGSAGGKAIGNMNLPGYTQAARAAATENGIVLSAVSQVRTAKVTGQVLTVSMAPGALYMANQGASKSSGAVSAGSKHRLTSIESWRKPRFTEDGRIIPYGQSRQPLEPIPNLGKNRAGQTVSNGKATIRFDKDGFPEFNAQFETLIEHAHIGSRKHPAHFRAANDKLFRAIQEEPGLARRLGLAEAEVNALQSSNVAPPGYRWHHHQDVGRMQLVAQEEHRLAIPHTGGMAIWGGGYPR